MYMSIEKLRKVVEAMEDSFKNEVWTSINGYEDIYEVSDHGRIRSVDRYDAAGHRRKGRMMAQSYDSYGYKTLKLSKDGKVTTFKVHRLVALNFIDNDDPEKKTTVNHINEVKDDNRVENLEWMCPKENSRYGNAQIRSGQGRRKPVKGTHLETGEIIRFDSATEAGKHGFGRANITSCCTGNLEHHKGYRWEYITEFINWEMDY